MRGLLMIEPLYHQTIKGNKTMTRRSGGLDAVNGFIPPKGSKKPAIDTNPDEWELVRSSNGVAEFWNKNDALNEAYCKARYKIGEVVYIKEPTVILNNRIQYKYDHSYITESIDKWANKLFMGQDKARAYVIITGIKCERLLDISDEDCIAEGIEEHPRALFHSYRFKNYLGDCLPIKCKDSFISLYKFANKAKEVPNLWVWVYQYEYLDGYKPNS